jgi:hypothetical protein
MGETDVGQYDRCEEVFGAPGTAVLYRRKMLDEVGLNDEDYFIMHEDDDLNLKARFGGWKCVYVPTAVVYHFHSLRIESHSPLKLYYGERNRIWMVVKFLPPSLIVSSLFFSFRRYMATVSFALRSKEGKAQAARRYSLTRLGFTLVRAWVDALCGLPRILKKRRQIQRTKKVSDQEIKNWLRQYSAPLKEIVQK